jgi:c-di-GMP-binding flagellar brake protein YcgR
MEQVSSGGSREPAGNARSEGDDGRPSFQLLLFFYVDPFKEEQDIIQRRKKKRTRIQIILVQYFHIGGKQHKEILRQNDPDLRLSGEVHHVGGHEAILKPGPTGGERIVSYRTIHSHVVIDKQRKDQRSKHPTIVNSDTNHLA